MDEQTTCFSPSKSGNWSPSKTSYGRFENLNAAPPNRIENGEIEIAFRYQ